MSTGLMSCVRENSPPLEMAGSESGAFSLPTNASDQQKRRRFNPLRNLRRIFRRRTLSGADTRSVSSTPSSPSSQTSSTPPTVIASLPAQNSLCSQGISPVDVTTMSSTAYPPHLISLTGSRDVGSYGLRVGTPFKISTSASGGFYAKGFRENSDSVFNRGREVLVPVQDMNEMRDMMDYQRSLSEGRLVDSDFSRDTLSQSHDSVFSESATASSLSLGLKAELFDVLRKRRNRPDASEEDLGLPRSPTTPQRKDNTAVNQSEVSSLSLLSMASSELDDELTSNYGVGDKTSSGYSSSKYSYETSRFSDDIDLDISAGNRLSHSAAHHKMAVRPKKKGPTRLRRPIEPSVLPSTPEVNEDSLKLSSLDIKNSFADKQKSKSHSLPPGVNAKILDMHSTKTVKEISTNIKRLKTETCSVSSSCVVRSVRNETDETCSSSTSTLERKEEMGGFFKRLMHRSSKKLKKSQDENDHFEENLPSISIEKLDSTILAKNDEITSTETKKELSTEIKSGLSALLNSMMSPSGHERTSVDSSAGPKLSKPKSGPAARQRILPQDLSASPPLEIKKPKTNPSIQLIENEKQGDQQISISPEKPQAYKINKPVQIEASDNLARMTKLSKSVDENWIPTRLKPTMEEQVPTLLFTHEHFEKKDRVQPKIVGLSPFQQKIYRVDSSTLEQAKPIVKQRKSVEKSKSFRYYSEESDNNNDTNLKRRENMPSLPDLTSSRKSMEKNELVNMSIRQRQESKPVPMGFEINDNNLIKLCRHEEPLPLTQGIYTKNIILASAKSTPVTSKHISPTCNQNITEIEENIDKLVKAPFVTVLKSEELKTVSSNVSTTIIRKSEMFETQEFSETVQSRVKLTDKFKSVSTELLNELEIKPNEKIKTESFEQKVLAVTPESKIDKNFTLELSETKSDSKCKEGTATTPTKARRSSAIFEKPEDVQVPEFMKIQLNRVDPARPKSNVVLAKNVKETDDRDMTRRFSNESVEITDTKPPLPPDVVANNKRTSLISVTKLQEDVSLKSPTKKYDEENNILRNFENTQQAPIERRKSVPDEKPKYLKKIEDQKAEKRKTAVDDNRKSIDEETGVVLRKKSLSANNQSSNKEDTPELMKVFARRSLKIKDTDDMQNFDGLNERTNSLKKSTTNLDSDKENQSSSEEKLDKLPKIEITIQPKPSLQNGQQLAQKNDDKIRTTVTDLLFRKPNIAANITTTTATPKPYVQPIRYSAVTTYRSISTAFGETKKGASTPLITSSTTTTTQTASLEQNTITADENERNNNNNHNTSNTNIRHTISCPSSITTKVNRRDDGEFKGILQRRAEWEKRAKEASK